MLVLLLLAGVPSPPAGAHPDVCLEPTFHEGIGPACAVDGGFVLRRDDGSLMFTHGPDPIPAPRLLVPGALRPSAEPACVTDPSEPAMRVTYARAFDDFDRYDTEVHAIRASVRYATAIVLAEALPLGADIRLKVRCDETGEIAVGRLTLPTSHRVAEFWTIDNDLRAQGLGDDLNKEWVAYDGTAPCGGCGGMSSLWWDDSPGASNWNNGGGLFSITFLDNYGGGVMDYQAYFDEVMLHEISHNLGAVQNSAPHSTGGFHCNDGTDIMCYADGGPSEGYSDFSCPGNLVGGLGAPYDCHHDDYFHPFPEPGSYLDTHWNVASYANRWIERVDLR